LSISLVESVGRRRVDGTEGVGNGSRTIIRDRDHLNASEVFGILQYQIVQRYGHTFSSIKAGLRIVVALNNFVALMNPAPCCITGANTPSNVVLSLLKPSGEAVMDMRSRSFKGSICPFALSQRAAIPLR